MPGYLVCARRISPTRYRDREAAFRAADERLEQGIECEVDELPDDPAGKVIVWRWDDDREEWVAQD